MNDDTQALALWHELMQDADFRESHRAYCAYATSLETRAVVLYAPKELMPWQLQLLRDMWNHPKAAPDE